MDKHEAQRKLSETYRRLRASDRRIAALEEQLERERLANARLQGKVDTALAVWAEAAGIA